MENYYNEASNHERGRHCDPGYPATPDSLAEAIQTGNHLLCIALLAASRLLAMTGLVRGQSVVFKLFLKILRFFAFFAAFRLTVFFGYGIMAYRPEKQGAIKKGEYMSILFGFFRPSWVVVSSKRRPPPLRRGFSLLYTPFRAFLGRFPPSFLLGTPCANGKGRIENVVFFYSPFSISLQRRGNGK
jgi:hypothetical protein